MNGQSIVPFPRLFAVFGYAVFTLIAVLLSVEGISWTVLTTHRHFFPPAFITNVRSFYGHCRGVGDADCIIRTSTDVTTASPVYDGAPWAEQFWKEQRRANLHGWRYEPFLMWSSVPFRGQYFNVDNTAFGALRRTTAPPSECSNKAKAQVWVFGGSSTFGIGDPDFATIPSQLSSGLNAPHAGCYEVTNFGVSGYNSNQELIFLLRQLQLHKPDVVIFFDGFNDAFVGAHSPAIPSGHMDQVDYQASVEGTTPAWMSLVADSSSVALATGVYRRMFPASGMKVSTLDANGRPLARDASEANLTLLARETLDNYERNVASVHALARQYGFRTYLYWQPWILSGPKPLSPPEKALVDNPLVLDPSGEAFLQTLSGVYAEAERRSATDHDFISLDRLFVSEGRTLFIDDIHTGPLGNQLIAERMAADILAGHGTSR